MQITKTPLNGCYIIEPKVFGDDRGFFFESFNQQKFNELTGESWSFVQDNHSRSGKNVLRGLHYQIPQAQGKLMRCIAGSILDVAVDIRKASSSFGKFVTVELSAQNKKMFWVPPGFAHGFLSLQDGTEVLYKTTDYYAPQYEKSILWNDPTLNIPWGLVGEPQLSAKDIAGVLLSKAEVFP